MNKMNKKGFTLIEMLVVIAIIAVLVSIIIPVVGNSTDKAAAATNAANLRSVKAQLVTAMLTNEAVDGFTFADDGAVSFTGTTDDLPTFKSTSDSADDSGFTVEMDGKNVIVKFDGNDIDQWAAYAS